jgi:hypothetical protein
MEPEVKVTEAVRNLLEDVVDRTGKQQTEEIKEIEKIYLEILKDEFKILTGRTFSRNKMARKLSVFSSLMSNYSFNNNFCQTIIIYLESLQAFQIYNYLLIEIIITRII